MLSASALGLYEDFRSTPQEAGHVAELGLGCSICRGPEIGVEEEGGASFSFPTMGVGV